MNAKIFDLIAQFELNPEKEYEAGGLLLEDINAEVKGAFQEYIKNSNQLDDRLKDNFNLDFLTFALQYERDGLFRYQGLKIIYDRYLARDAEGKLLETPQWFWMRVAMGLAVNEDKPNERAIEFYDLLSTLMFINSTPTLFNSGKKRPQLSSCFISYTSDDTESIMQTIADDAQMSKWAGGVSNYWSAVRGRGAKINGTGGESSGVIPFLKIVEATARAFNQSGKRPGAIINCLDIWHPDILEFLDLRKDTGDHRMRTHDTNTSIGVPDLFMKRVQENGTWSLFDPSVVALHNVWGDKFDELYLKAELNGVQTATISAVELARKWAQAYHSTGHPFAFFRDTVNRDNNQKHVGMVHSSNLCHEIVENTSDDEIAVCNLGSINVALLDPINYAEELQKIIPTAVRMLDNVIDINYYPVDKARNSNLKHRPIGLGIMGMSDFIMKQGIALDSNEAETWNDVLINTIAYKAVVVSNMLGKERGSYPSFEGSEWSQRGWDFMRNSNILAIAPTATIGKIAGVTSGIDPVFSNIYVDSNLSGEFVTVNYLLVEALRGMNLWNQEMLDDLKRNNGSIQTIDRIPQSIKDVFKCAHEWDHKALIRNNAVRQRSVCQSQSFNLYYHGNSGKYILDLLMYSWEQGLKTLYYMHAKAPGKAEKSTVTELNTKCEYKPGQAPKDCDACQ